MNILWLVSRRFACICLYPIPRGKLNLILGCVQTLGLEGWCRHADLDSELGESGLLLCSGCEWLSITCSWLRVRDPRWVLAHMEGRAGVSGLHLKVLGGGGEPRGRPYLCKHNQHHLIYSHKPSETR